MTAHLRILGGAPLDALVAAALDLLPSAPRLVVAAARRDLAQPPSGPARTVAGSLHDAGRQARLLVPPASLPGAWLRSRSTCWVAVDVSARSGRLDRVWLPEALAGRDPIVLVNRLETGRASRDPVAIGAWARFANPRQRTGAAASREGGGLAVEIALAVTPALVLLVAEDSTGTLLLAADDQIAAELAGLAYLEQSSKEPLERAGPWEDPTVQRATELDLGVRVPAQIDPRPRWLGPTGPAADAFTARTAAWLRRIGVRA